MTADWRFYIHSGLLSVHEVYTRMQDFPEEAAFTLLCCVEASKSAEFSQRGLVCGASWQHMSIVEVQQVSMFKQALHAASFRPPLSCQEHAISECTQQHKSWQMLNECFLATGTQSQGA